MKGLLIFFLLFSPNAISKYNNDLDCNKVEIDETILTSFKYDKSELSRWYLSSNKKIKGVSITFHGLNAKPSMMNPLISVLNNLGFHVLRGSLTGHRGSLDEMKHTKREDWLFDVLKTFCKAKARADKLGVPLVWVGHSLGGLIIFDLLNTHQKKLKVDKAILFAPAFKLHWHLDAFSWIFNIKDSWSLPSRNLPEYRSQKVCTFAAYRALMESVDAFKPINIPTLIMMDPGDELVSYKGILKMIKKDNLNNWKLQAVDTSNTTHSKTYRHLVFNEASFGTKEWNRVVKLMENFLWEENGTK